MACCALLIGLSFSSFLPFRGCFGQALFPHFSPVDSKTVQRSALCRSRRELSNEYLLAKIGVDTAENEPLEVWGKIFNIIQSCPYSTARSRRAAAGRAQLLANSSSTTGGIPKVEQTAPLRHGAAAWAWGFWTLRKSEKISSKFSNILASFAKFKCKIFANLTKNCT